MKNASALLFAVVVAGCGGSHAQPRQPGPVSVDAASCTRAGDHVAAVYAAEHAATPALDVDTCVASATPALLGCLLDASSIATVNDCERAQHKPASSAEKAAAAGASDDSDCDEYGCDPGAQEPEAEDCGDVNCGGDGAQEPEAEDCGDPNCGGVAPAAPPPCDRPPCG